MLFESIEVERCESAVWTLRELSRLIPSGGWRPWRSGVSTEWLSSRRGAASVTGAGGGGQEDNMKDER